MDNKYFRGYNKRVTKKNILQNKCAHCKCDITNLPKTRKFCNKCLKKGIRDKKYEYKCRIIVKSSTKNPVYGITIPKEMIDKYSLRNKKFKIKIFPKGKFILYSKLNEKEKK